MSSIIRRGTIPHAATGTGPYLDELYTLKGFFGDWAQLYRKHNTAHPKRWSSDDLMYQGADTNALKPSDKDDPAGEPIVMLTGDGFAVSLSRRSHAMPFAERNADHHQIRFYHRGNFKLETELGAMDVEAGDFVVIPKGLIYREIPMTDDNAVVIFETEAIIRPAEELWDSVGFTSFFIDYSTMVLPEPVGVPDDEEEDDTETEVRVKWQGRWETMVYDFDPCHDCIGWLGDPVIYKMNVWSFPSAGTSHGTLPPPTGCVLMAEDRSFFFNVMKPRPFPNVPAPDGSFGAPGHFNDYEEVWFNHVSDRVPATDGHLWHLPQTVPHPGLKRAPEYPQNPVRLIREVKINFDTATKLNLTAEAREALFPEPQVAVYTSLYGTRVDLVPEQALQHVKK